MLYYFYVKKEDVEMNKIGTITVSVFKSNEKNITSFEITADNENVEQISYIIEDTLKAY